MLCILEAIKGNTLISEGMDNRVGHLYSCRSSSHTKQVAKTGKAGFCGGMSSKQTPRKTRGLRFLARPFKGWMGFDRLRRQKIQQGVPNVSDVNRGFSCQRRYQALRFLVVWVKQYKKKALLPPLYVHLSLAHIPTTIPLSTSITHHILFICN